MPAKGVAILSQVADTCADIAELDRYDSLVQLAFAHNSYVTQLESMGYRVGYVMAERVSRDAPKLLTELEVEPSNFCT
ncbi:hypothetical protein COOONC_00637 [Cooperia oncophora]